MNKYIFTLLLLVTLLVAPVTIFATIDPGTLPQVKVFSITDLVNAMLNFIWPAFSGFAVLMFILAGGLFLTAQGNPGRVENARLAVIWGIVGIVIGILAFSIPFAIRSSIGA